MTGLTLKSYHFRREREAGWAELEELLRQAESGGLESLSAEQLYRLPALYRSALSSLSVARAISLDKNVIAYLESLAARAYVQVYGTRRHFLHVLAEFFRYRFPSLVWQLRGGLALSILLLLLGVACGFILTVEDNERFYSFVHPAMAGERSPASSREELLEVLKSGGEAGREDLTVFASFLFTHNARIGLLCFVLGAAAGVPVVLLLLSNGMLLGAFAAIYYQQGLALPFWAWVLPHGVTELLAVCVCGAAGFGVARGLLLPGPYGRLESLAHHGREAATVVAGAVAMFLLAALLEGFFRQQVTGETPRLVVAGLTALLWLAYFGQPAWQAARARWRRGS